MLSQQQTEKTERIKAALPSREILIPIAMILVVILAMGFIGIAEENATDDTPGDAEDEEELQSTIEAIGYFISVIVLAVAIPNGAYGFLQYMFAGSNVEQDEKGRQRIRNTFIALAGVAVINVAVRFFDSIVGVSGFIGLF